MKLHLFHSWGKWNTEEKTSTQSLLGGSVRSSFTSTSTLFIQWRECERCGKRKVKKL